MNNPYPQLMLPFFHSSFMIAATTALSRPMPRFRTVPRRPFLVNQPDDRLPDERDLIFAFER